MPPRFSPASLGACEKSLQQLCVDYLVDFRRIAAVKGTLPEVDWFSANEPLRALIDVLWYGLPGGNPITIQGVSRLDIFQDLNFCLEYFNRGYLFHGR